MKQINDGGPAFPSHGSMGEVAHEGMTMRDYFAANVTLDMTIKERSLAEKIVGKPCPEDGIELIEFGLLLEARLRYMKADAMLKAREA